MNFEKDHNLFKIHNENEVHEFLIKTKIILKVHEFEKKSLIWRNIRSLEKANNLKKDNFEKIREFE